MFLLNSIIDNKYFLREKKSCSNSNKKKQSEKSLSEYKNGIPMSFIHCKSANQLEANWKEM